MKSVLTIAAITLMLVSVAQAMFVNGILRVLTPKHQPLSMFKPSDSMDINEKDIRKLFTPHNTTLKSKGSTINNVYYIDGKKGSELIRVACGSKSNTKNYAIQAYEDLYNSESLHVINSDFGIVVPKEQFTISGGNTCYILPYIKCEPTHNTISKGFGNAWLQDLDRITEIWRKIGTGLDYLKKKGWYTHMDIEGTCLIGEKDNYKPYFVNFNNAIPVGKGLIEAENINNIVLKDTLHKFNLKLHNGFVNWFVDTPEMKWKYNWEKTTVESAKELTDFNKHHDYLKIIDHLLLAKDEK